MEGGRKIKLSFKKNQGTLDRIIRVIVGVLLIGLAIFQPFLLSRNWLVVSFIVGVYMLGVAALGY